MPKVLTERQVRFFHDEGYIAPLRVMSTAEAAACRAKLEAFEAETGMAAASVLQKTHLYFDWTWRLARSAAVTGIIQDLLGSDDVLVMASRFWIKEAGDRLFTSWHQDLAYFGLDPQEMISVWIAITPASRASGAMKFIPRSHHALRHHNETFAPDNMLSRGQAVADVDEAAAVDGVLEPGELSVHHGNLLHSSPPNVSGDRRIGLGLMVFPAHVRSTTGRRSVTVLAGQDRSGHWDHDPLPTQDRDPAIWALMRTADAAYRDRTIVQEADLARS